ncbi:MAG: acyl-CoA dehydratase activase-related protein [Polyangiales bacterium]
MSSGCLLPNTPRTRSKPNSRRIQLRLRGFSRYRSREFQKEGFSKEELLAGLAQVLPKNVWQYVVGVPRMAALGRTFVLQGGTQYNMAAVKAQVDYIKERVPGAEVYVHPHSGEAGAIGAGMETLRVVKRRGYSTFIGIDAAIDLEYKTINDETTTCHFCANNCSRTFIDAYRPDGSTSRYISGFSCEKGMVESKEAMEELVKERRAIMREFPNLVTYEGLKAFKRQAGVNELPEAGASIGDMNVTRTFFGRIKREEFSRSFERSNEAASEKRSKWRVGIPRVLNMYSTAPFFRTYFEVLGVRPKNIVFSDTTTEELWQEGGKYGSVDPCYPSKVAQAHFHNLLFHKHEEAPLDVIFFPILNHVPSFVEGAVDHASCPIVAGTPDVMKAAFTKEQDYFGKRGIRYMDPAFSFTEPTLLKRRLFEAFIDELGITEDENNFAVDEGLAALKRFDEDLQHKGRAILDQVQMDNKMAILMIGRPYHLDPGLHHGIPEEFQVLGYPILSIRSIPKDKNWLRPFFDEDVKKHAALIAKHDIPDASPDDAILSVNDVWPENYSANSAQKVWATKFAARHPNVALLDLSSFKCGHDAPTYGIIDGIVSRSGVPHVGLHDIDANKPGGSIKIRVKTYGHSLKLRQEHLQDLADRRQELAYRIDQKRLALLEMKRDQTRVRDETLSLEIDALREKVALYQRAKVDSANGSEASSKEVSLIQLKKKDGKVLQAPTCEDAAE